jgi:hypothetical protein
LNRPGSVRTSLPPARAELYRLGGVALGRFALVDGRPADQEWEARLMVERFRPGTVPVLLGHDGPPLGYLTGLRSEGPDLRFFASVLLGPGAMLERLRRGGVPVSIEVADYPPPRREVGRGGPVRYYTGRIEAGPNLVGLALLPPGVRPAARGSVAWLEPTLG